MASERDAVEGTSQQPDELVMRKHDNMVRVSAVVNSERVFYAETEIGRSQQVMKAGIQAFVSQGYEVELDDADTEGAFQ